MGQPSTQSAALSAEPCPEALVSRDDYTGVESLRCELAPASAAVFGAGRRPGSVGRAIFRNIVASGYLGRVYPVNPHARHIEGVHCVPSVARLPEPVDLAVLAVPPVAVADV